MPTHRHRVHVYGGTHKDRSSLRRTSKRLSYRTTGYRESAKEKRKRRMRR